MLTENMDPAVDAAGIRVSLRMSPIAVTSFYIKMWLEG
jgi:hypothetical protein